MTSNLGSGDVKRQAFGFNKQSREDTESAQLRTNVEDALKQAFRPEFLNRIDEYIVFDSLDEEDIRLIVDKFINEVCERVSDLKVSLTLTDDARNWLAITGFDRMYGARPLKRAIQRYVESPLSRRLLAGEFPEGSLVFVDVAEDEITFQLCDVDDEQIEVAETGADQAEESEKTPIGGNSK